MLRNLHRLPAPADIRPFLGVDTRLPEFLLNLVSIETGRARDAGIISDIQADRFVNILTQRLVQEGDLETWCLLHGDLKPDHILLDPARTAVLSVLDFGDVSVGDPIWDLAVLTAHHPERLTDVTVGYQPKLALRMRTTRMVAHTGCYAACGQPTGCIPMGSTHFLNSRNWQRNQSWPAGSIFRQYECQRAGRVDTKKGIGKHSA